MSFPLFKKIYVIKIYIKYITTKYVSIIFSKVLVHKTLLILKERNKIVLLQFEKHYFKRQKMEWDIYVVVFERA